VVFGTRDAVPSSAFESLFFPFFSRGNLWVRFLTLSSVATFLFCRNMESRAVPTPSPWQYRPFFSRLPRGGKKIVSASAGFHWKHVTPVRDRDPVFSCPPAGSWSPFSFTFLPVIGSPECFRGVFSLVLSPRCYSPRPPSVRDDPSNCFF